MEILGYRELVGGDAEGMVTHGMTWRQDSARERVTENARELLSLQPEHLVDAGVMGKAGAGMQGPGLPLALASPALVDGGDQENRCFREGQCCRTTFKSRVLSSASTRGPLIDSPSYP